MRRQQFFQQQRIDFKITWNKYYEKYRKKLESMRRQLCRKTMLETPFSLLNLKKEGKLPPSMKRVSPLHYN